jgi:hypothetical protein
MHDVEVESLRAELVAQADANQAMEAHVSALEMDLPATAGENRYEPSEQTAIAFNDSEEGAAAGGRENEAEDGAPPKEQEEDMPSSFGLIIPNVSKALTDKLLEDDEINRQAAAAIQASKEAAAEALRRAAAVDAADPSPCEDFFGYDHVVRMYNEVQARRGPAPT